MLSLPGELAPRSTCRKARAGLFFAPHIEFAAVPQEPSTKRTIVFIEDQNLFHAARLADGYTYPQVGATKNGDPTDLECLSQNDKRFTRFAIGWSPRQGTIDQVAPANVRSPVPG